MRKRQRDQTTSTDRKLYENLHIANDPPTVPSVDCGVELDHADQLAIGDAASGSLDTFGVQALAGQLHRVDEFDAKAQLNAHGAHGQKLYSKVLDTHLTHRVSNGNGTTTSLRYLREQQRLQAKKLAAAEQDRAKAGGELDGTPDADGTVWSGKPPPAPIGAGTSVRFRSTVVALWFMLYGATALLFGFELIIISSTLRVDLRTDDSLAALVYAIPAVLAATLLPHLAGIRLAGLLRRRRMVGADRLIPLAIAFWLSAVVVLARIRTDTAEQAAITRAASLRQVAASSIDPAEIFNYSWGFARWMILLAGIGAALITFKAVTYNPAYSAAVHSDTRIALLRQQLAITTAAYRSVADRVKVQKMARRTNMAAWTYHAENTLPALAEAQKRRYISTLIEQVGDPDFTGSLLSTRPDGHPEHDHVAHRSQLAPGASVNGVGPVLPVNNHGEINKVML